MFYERPHHETINREQFATMAVEPAKLADTTTGIGVRHGGHMMFLTMNQAIQLATRIADIATKEVNPIEGP